VQARTLAGNDSAAFTWSVVASESAHANAAACSARARIRFADGLSIAVSPAARLSGRLQVIHPGVLSGARKVKKGGRDCA
jgi:hypothetical protein